MNSWLTQFTFQSFGVTNFVDPDQWRVANVMEYVGDDSTFTFPEINKTNKPDSDWKIFLL